MGRGLMLRGFCVGLILLIVCAPLHGDGAALDVTYAVIKGSCGTSVGEHELQGNDTASFDACRLRCDQESRCSAFEWLDDGSTCRLYNHFPITPVATESKTDCRVKYTSPTASRNLVADRRGYIGYRWTSWGECTSGSDLVNDYMDCLKAADDLGMPMHAYTPSGRPLMGCQTDRAVVYWAGIPEASLRLSGGWSTTGTLLVYHSGQWGTVCDDHFDENAAKVACRQLGFGGGRVYSGTAQTAGPIWLDNVYCTGAEARLSSCSHNGWGFNDCSHDENVEISCSFGPTAEAEYWPVCLSEGAESVAVSPSANHTNTTEEIEWPWNLIFLLVCCCPGPCIALYCFNKHFCPQPGTGSLALDEESPPDSEIELPVGARCPPHWFHKDLSTPFDERYDAPDAIANAVQQMFNATWKDCFTRDRKPPNPIGLKVVSVQRVEDQEMWSAYLESKARIRRNRGPCNPVYSLDGDLDSGHVQTDPWARLLAGGDGQMDGDLNEHYFFHGTTPEGANGISEDGFSINKAGSNAGTMFGRGAYFAERCTKSDEYAGSGSGIYRGLYAMVLCRVCCGEMLRVTRSDHALIEKEVLRKKRYDAVLGDREASVGTYREFVVYRESQIYPEYVVIYKRLYEDVSSSDDDSS